MDYKTRILLFSKYQICHFQCPPSPKKKLSDLKADDFHCQTGFSTGLGLVWWVIWAPMLAYCPAPGISCQPLCLLTNVLSWIHCGCRWTKYNCSLYNSTPLRPDLQGSDACVLRHTLRPAGRLRVVVNNLNNGWRSKTEDDQKSNTRLLFGRQSIIWIGALGGADYSYFTCGNK